MKKLPFSMLAAVSVMLAASPAAFGQKTAEQTVAFRASSGEYVGTVAQGGLRASSKVITPKHIFQMIDLKDAGFADGDEVKIKETGASAKPSFWQETADGNLSRVAKGDDASCVFKLKKNGVTVQLQTAGGKFVAVEDRAMTLVDEPGKTASFELILNPTPAEGGASKPAATEEAAKAARTPATNVSPAGSPKP